MVLALEKISVADISDRVLLSGVSWAEYESLLAEVERSGRHYKVTYSSGELEIELPGRIHEIVKAFARSMLEAYLLDHNIDFVPLGETTWQRRDLAKGVEGDECYYIQNAGIIGARSGIDLNRDPAPDLAIEVEATRPLLPKLPVYASIGVREIWHINTAGEIQIMLLRDGRYDVADTSEAVPAFTATLLRYFISLRHELGHVKALQRFRAETE